MLDLTQLNRCSFNWTVSLVLLFLFFGLSLITVMLYVLTILAVARETRRKMVPQDDSRSFLWSDRIMFLAYVSTLRLDDTASLRV